MGLTCSTLEEFYTAPITLETLPQVGLRLLIISFGSLAVGAHAAPAPAPALSCAVCHVADHALC